MIRLAFLLSLALTSTASDSNAQDLQGPPLWAIHGIAYVETRSYWDEEGRFHYVDKRVGDAGELGPLQVTRAAWDMVRGDQLDFHRGMGRTATAIDSACLYLCHLRARCSSWDEAVAAYHRGLGGRHRPEAIEYARKVRAYGIASLTNYIE